MKILVLTDKEYYFPEDPKYLGLVDRSRVQMEYQVCQALRQNGYYVVVVPFIAENCQGVLREIIDQRPDVVFNLAQHIQFRRSGEASIIGLLEVSGVPFTGPSVVGSVLTTDKALARERLAASGLPTPRWCVVLKDPSRADFPYLPAIVKPRFGGASEGLGTKAIVTTREGLVKACAKILKRSSQPALVEEFIRGRELTIGLLGNRHIYAFPVREMLFRKTRPDGTWIMTDLVKHNAPYRATNRIRSVRALLPLATRRRIIRDAKIAFHALGMRDYGRMDIRLSTTGVPYIVDANANPSLRPHASSIFFPWEGMKYHVLIRRIVLAALSRTKSAAAANFQDSVQVY